jgi:NAD(P) transhydrogenase subunit beta
MTALSLEVLLGGITVTGSLMAFIKLQDWIRGTPITYRGQNIFNMSLLALTVGMFGYLIYDPSAHSLFYAMAGVAFVFGVLLVLPIGAADMPVVISLMNSYAGLAAAATGFAISNNVLIIAGATWFLRTSFDSDVRAMNRSITNVLFERSGAETSAARWNARDDARGEAEDIAVQLAYAGQVIFVRARHGHCASATRGSRACEHTRDEGCHGQVRDPSGSRPNAGSHERAAG